MLDLIVLFTIFVGLVSLLAVVHWWQVSAKTASSAANHQLLAEWLQAHKLELPSVQCLLSVLNRKLQEMESEDWERLELVEMLPRTELPVFQLFQAQLSEDGRDIILCCNVEWPMCLPGVAVSVLEHGAEEPFICHFTIDWLDAKLKLVFGEKNGVLMLSSENLQPVRMGVACMVVTGQAKDNERAASFVADAIQQVLMELRLDQVPLVSLYSHTPSLPLVLVSTPEESVPPRDQEEAALVERQSEPEDSEPSPHTNGSDAQESNVLTQQNSIPAAITPVDIMTPVTEEAGPLVAEEDVTSSLAPTNVNEQESQLANGLSQESAMPQDVSMETQQQTVKDPPTANATSSVSTTPPTSPTWRRTSSYENLQEISVGVSSNKPTSTPKKGPSLRGSNSSEHLFSPIHRVSSPMGRAMTLSMSGSEAESIYGADDRIPSSLVFEVKDSIKVRHIVALSTTHASKLRRHFSNAKKLHIYNDHCFMATHLKNRADCSVCGEKISKLFGKQAYVCRDCSMVVHKQCHYKTETSCPTSSVPTMELIYPESTSVSGL